MSRNPEVIWRDLSYANADGIDLLARCYTSEHSVGEGIVMVHGGAWTANDRTTPWVVCEALARKGLTVLSLDFRCGPNHQHPAASADIAAGIRFFKLHAGEFEINAERIGIIGSSSGGQLVLYTGLLPDIPEHQTTAVKIDAATIDRENRESARPAYIIALWPVSNPLYRYSYAKRVDRPELVAAHDGYFGTEAAMVEASVPRVLAEVADLQPPPTLVIQPGEDANVPESMTLDLLRMLQTRDAELTYRYMPGLPHAFAYEPSRHSERCTDYVWSFICEILQPPSDD